MSDEAPIIRRLQQMEDREALRNLVVRYATLLDQRDIEGLLGLFDPHIRSSLIEQGFVHALKDVRLTTLHVGGTTVELDAEHADRARGVVECRAQIQTSATEMVTQLIEYHDRYVRREGRWYFRARDHRLRVGVTWGARPQQMGPVDWPRRHVGIEPHHWQT